MRFLIDECLSLDLVSVAAEAGYEAHHVVHIGKAGWKDWNVARYAGEGDFIVVTNNADDFLKLYAAIPIHAGLIIILPNEGRDIHKRLFRGALDQLAIMGEPVNCVLEVDLEGDDFTYEIYDLPAT